jgi:hypothetical protein
MKNKFELSLESHTSEHHSLIKVHDFDSRRAEYPNLACREQCFGEGIATVGSRTYGAGRRIYGAAEGEWADDAWSASKLN